MLVVDSKKKHSAPCLLSNQSLTGPQKKVLQQVELQSSTALTFPNTTSSTTSGGTILATANFTGSGNFSVVALPTVTSSNNCGVFTSPLLRLAVLVASVDATVSPFSPTGLYGTQRLWHACVMLLDVHSSTSYRCLLATWRKSRLCQADTLGCPAL